jgi:hypothetical protein
MNEAFQKVLAAEYGSDTKLGMPARDEAHGLRRLAAMKRMTDGNGFRVPATKPRRDAQGLTRGQRRRAAYAVAMAKVSEERAPEYMHGAARVRAGLQAAAKPMTGFVATLEAA